MRIDTPPTWRPPIQRTNDPDWDKMQGALLHAVALGVTQGIPAAAEQVFDRAFDSWPVATGRSRDALELTYETTDSTFSAVLDDAVPYKNDIHNGETVAELVVAPAEEAIPDVVLELERLITAIGRA